MRQSIRRFASHLAAVALTLAIGSGIGSSDGNADAPLSAGTQALIDLLSPEMAGPSDPLSTEIVRWATPIRVDVVGGEPGARQRAVETVLRPLAGRFTGLTNVETIAGAGLDHPNVLFVFAENAPAFQAFEPRIDELFEGDTRYSQAVIKYVKGRNRQCVYVSIDLHKLYWRAVVYVPYKGSDPKFDSCIASMMAGVFGLQGRLPAGTSIRERANAIVTFTDTDVAALGILYDPGIGPGTPLREILPAIERAGARLSP